MNSRFPTVQEWAERCNQNRIFYMKNKQFFLEKWYSDKANQHYRLVQKPIGSEIPFGTPVRVTYTNGMAIAQ